jgi:hypothetical protein
MKEKNYEVGGTNGRDWNGGCGGESGEGVVRCAVETIDR